MTNERRTITLGFCDTKVPEGQHVCYIYNDDEERLAVMARYLKSGMELGEKLLYLVDAMTSRQMLEYLKSQDLVFNSARPEDLIISEAASAYCPTGFFKTDEMLGVVRDFYLDAIAEGYAGSRGTGEMSWCLSEGLARKEDLMTYEARLTGLLEQYPYTAC